MLAYRSGEPGAIRFLGIRVAAIAIAYASPSISADVDVQPKWLEQRCMLRSISDRQFEACVRALVANLPKLDPNRREHFGEKYDPKAYVACRLRLERNQTDCEHFILRRREWPEYWPEGAKRVKWPDPPKESVYRRGMKPKEYWEALCKAEAGEFVYRTVKDVEGFLLVRPRGQESDYALADRNSIEDAYGLLEFALGDDDPRPGKRFFRRDEANYSFIESARTGARGDVVWLRHSLDTGRLDALRKSRTGPWDDTDFTSLGEVPLPIATYAVTWRGIRRERDLELGVSGGELAISDLRTGAVLAIRRGYALDGFAARGVTNRTNWRSASGCPLMMREPSTMRAFVNKVLAPKQDTR